MQILFRKFKNGLQIGKYYEPFNDQDCLFISLNKEQFLELLSDNWKLDQNDFIN